MKKALDLCLTCKGYKGDCPVSVDMATYKAEFLSHYYARRLRPVTAYTMGLIYWWSRLATHAPEAANLLTQTPLLRSVSRAAAGIAPERRIPAFASQPFKQWFRRRGPRNAGKPAVILLPDTFNNYFHPGIAQAAVEVLAAICLRVEVPEQPLCCARPLYDYGMLRLARCLLRQILDRLRPQIANGILIIVLEPSCVAVFRNELVNLFPNDEDTKRLSWQMFLLSEFLEKKVVTFSPRGSSARLWSMGTVTTRPS